MLSPALPILCMNLYSIFSVILRLRLPHLIIFPVLLLHQFVMTSCLYQPSLMKYRNLFTKLARRQSVRNINRCFTSNNLIKICINLIL